MMLHCYLHILLIIKSYSPVTINVGINTQLVLDTRGQHTLITNDLFETRCIVCSVCQRICPAAVIRVSGSVYKQRHLTEFIFIVMRCINCSGCSAWCPVCAIEERPMNNSITTNVIHSRICCI